MNHYKFLAQFDVHLFQYHPTPCSSAILMANRVLFSVHCELAPTIEQRFSAILKKKIFGEFFGRLISFVNIAPK